MALSVLLCAQTEANAFATPVNIKAAGATFIVAAKKPKCAAPTVADFEGTDMEGVTAKCDAIFNACVNEALACSVRLRKCKEFDKMDRDGSCYKKKR
ncbi:MAG: hypothetical protein N2444_00745 [Methylocystis sp.]|nr:hypothetical protein [Methylocystis sp.]